MYGPLQGACEPCWTRNSGTQRQVSGNRGVCFTDPKIVRRGAGWAVVSIWSTRWGII